MREVHKGKKGRKKGGKNKNRERFIGSTLCERHEIEGKGFRNRYGGGKGIWCHQRKSLKGTTSPGES